MFWFFCSHASKLKITYSLWLTPDRRRYDRRSQTTISNGAIFSSTALFVIALYCSCWIKLSRFSIDPLKTNFPLMFKNSMQHRCSIAPPRFSVLRFTFTPAKIQACVTLLRDHKYISIVLIKRRHSYQFASGIKPSSPSARIFAANQVRIFIVIILFCCCLLYTSPSPRDA